MRVADSLPLKHDLATGDIRYFDAQHSTIPFIFIYTTHKDQASADTIVNELVAANDSYASWIQTETQQ